MKNLAILVRNFPLVTETFIARQIMGLEGHVVTENFHRDNKYLFDINYTQVYELSSKHSKVSLKLFDLFRRIRFRMFGVASQYWYPGYNKTFSNYIIKNNIKVVLAQFGSTGVNAMKACKKNRTLLVVQFFGRDGSVELNNKKHLKKVKALFRYASKIVVLTESMKSKFVDLGCVPEKIHVINVGVPLDHSERAAISESSTFKFLGVGRFVEKKSPLSTIKAFEICASNHKQVELVLIGGGTLEEQVKQYVQKSKFKERIKILGYMSQIELKKHYLSAHAFVQHSVKGKDGDTEGWPVGIAEAASFGLPIISTLHEGIKDQVVNGETGYLVHEYDIKAMAEGMNKLASSVENCQKMGVRSREYIEEVGSLDKQMTELKNVIIDLIA